MALISSNSKRAHTNKKANLRNKSQKSSLKTTMRKFECAVEENDVETVKTLAPVLQSKLERSAQKNIKHKNYVKRQQSRIARGISSVE